VDQSDRLMQFKRSPLTLILTFSLREKELVAPTGLIDTVDVLPFH
jgi:hypothetical protein